MDPEARLFRVEIDTPGMKRREHFIVIKIKSELFCSLVVILKQ